MIPDSSVKYVCLICNLTNIESLFRYPQSDIHRLLKKFIPFLQCFTDSETKIFAFADRLKAQKIFQAKYNIDPHDTTILLDASPILIDFRDQEPMSGNGGVWHEKSKHRGT